MAKLAIVILSAMLGAVTCHGGYYGYPPPSPSPAQSYTPGLSPRNTYTPPPPSPSPSNSYPSGPNPPTTYTPPPPSLSPPNSYNSGPSPPNTYTPPPAAPGLKVGYYDQTCPQAEHIVRRVIGKAIEQYHGIGAGLIRMLFHDCFVEGCDASVLLDPTPDNPQPEKLGIPNFPSLRGFEVIDAAKDALEEACHGIVSCADIVAFAGRDASYFLSNYAIDFEMPAGRFDGRKSFANETLQFLPAPFFNLDLLNASFAVKGLNIEDMVVLSGAHTVGRSHCSSFSDRLSPSNSNIRQDFADSLRKQCSSQTSSSDPTVMQDMVTPNKLDSQYYKNVLDRTVLFMSDAVLLSSRSTTMMVLQNAYVQGWWEKKFKAAMVKMATIDVKTARNGEIRRNCRVVNY